MVVCLQHLIGVDIQQSSGATHINQADSGLKLPRDFFAGLDTNSSTLFSISQRSKQFVFITSVIKPRAAVTLRPWPASTSTAARDKLISSPWYSTRLFGAATAYQAEFLIWLACQDLSLFVMLDPVLNEGDVLRKAKVDNGFALRAGEPPHDKEIGPLKFIQTFEAERLQHFLLKVLISD